MSGSAVRAKVNGKYLKGYAGGIFAWKDSFEFIYKHQSDFKAITVKRKDAVLDETPDVRELTTPIPDFCPF